MIFAMFVLCMFNLYAVYWNQTLPIDTLNMLTYKVPNSTQRTLHALQLELDIARSNGCPSKEQLFNTTMEHRTNLRRAVWNNSLKAKQNISLIKFPKKLKLFKPIPTFHRLKQRELFLAVTSLLKRESIPYLLYAGTLIGAFRHQTLIPWDDDVDLLLNITDQSKLLYLFADGQSPVMMNNTSLHLSKSNVIYYKIYLSSGLYWHKFNGWNYSWPFADVFFFKENATHITILEHEENVWRKNDVFPIQLRPCEGTMQPIPFNVPKLFSDSNITKTCVSNDWDHRIEQGTDISESPCSFLYPIYPFVFRH